MEFRNSRPSRARARTHTVCRNRARTSLPRSAQIWHIATRGHLHLARFGLEFDKYKALHVRCMRGSGSGISAILYVTDLAAWGRVCRKQSWIDMSERADSNGDSIILCAILRVHAGSDDASSSRGKKRKLGKVTCARAPTRAESREKQCTLRTDPVRSRAVFHDILILATTASHLFFANLLLAFSGQVENKERACQQCIWTTHGVVNNLFLCKLVMPDCSLIR